jgi:hypothetical protein
MGCVRCVSRGIKMILKLKRESFGERATIGSLYSGDTFLCHTLEDVDRHLETGGVKVQNETCIPRGLYKVIIDHSEHFGRDLPHVLDVPQFAGIRIHPGNTDLDTDGCILLGESIINEDFISNSKLTFERFFDALKSDIDSGFTTTLEIT